MKALTIRNVPDDLAEALEREKHRRETSLNQTVIDLLGQALGVGMARSNGLKELGGCWSEEEHAAFQRAVSAFDAIDAELWG